MTYVESPGFEETLASFIRSASVSSAYAPGRFDKILYFFNDILVYSHIPITVDTFIWYILLCFFDFFMIYLSCPFGWFNSIKVSMNDSNVQYLFSKTWLQRFSIIGISLGMLLVMYFWAKCSYYHPRKQLLTTFSATALYAIIYYLPLFFIPFCGFLFGSLLLTNIEEEADQYSMSAISIALSFVFIFLLATISMFNILVKYSLTMRNGQFAFWRPPFQSHDYLILFLTAMFYPIRMTIEPRSATVICVIQFIYGIHFLIELRNITFISLVPLTIQIKISLDIIIFSIFTIINIWFPTKDIVLYSIFIIISFVSNCLSLFVLAILIQNSSAKIATITTTKLPSTKSSISMLRFAINLSMTDVTRPDIIKCIALWRFSFELVPDIVRYCIVTKQSMKEIVIPHRSVGSIRLSPFQFLSFQVERFECYSAKDGSSQIDSKYEELNQLLKRSEIIIDNFWSDPSFDQMDIYSLGYELKAITNKFAFELTSFPHSKKITEIWNAYITNVSHIDFPDPLKRCNPMELLYNPDATIYGYLARQHNQQEEIERPVPVEKKKSSVDLYLDSITKKSVTPLFVFYIVFFIAFIAITIVVDHYSYSWTENRLKHFFNTSTFLRLQTELSNEKLAFIEPFVPIPSYREIADLLGIDDEAANTFCLTRIASRAQMTDLTSLYTFITKFPSPPNPGKCQDISLFLLLKYKLSDNFNQESAYCRMFYLNFYSQYIALQSKRLFPDFHMDETIGKVSSGVFISIFIAISSVLFAIFLYYDFKSQKRMIFTVKTISHIFKQNRNLKTKSYNISLGVSFSITIWVFLMSFIAILYVICQIPTDKEDRKISRFLNQISIISRISRTAQDSLAYREGTQISQFNMPNIAIYLSYSRGELVNLVDQLNEIGIDKIFQNIHPLDKWSVNGNHSFSSLLLDYAQLLSNMTNSAEFEFYYARYIFLFHISVLVESTLPEMVNQAQLEIQKVTSVFIFSYFAIFVAVFICMFFYYILYQKKKIWYFAATTYLRRSILKDGSCFQFIRKMLSNPKENYLEELPYPFIICDIKTGIILYSNSKIDDYIEYSSNQIVGQKLENILKINNDICAVNVNEKLSILQLHFDQINDKYQTITMTDVTDVYETNQTYKEFINIMRPNMLTLPLRNSMVYIKIRYEPKEAQQHQQQQNPSYLHPQITKYSTQATLPSALPNNNNDNNAISGNYSFIGNNPAPLGQNNSPAFDSENLLDLFDDAESNFTNAIRISCGASFYTAIINMEDFNGLKFLEFLESLTKKTENEFIAAVMFGILSCLPLDEDETRVVVCGETAKRANDCCIFGIKNRIYMDDVIASNFVGDAIENAEFLKESLIVISPTVQPQI